MKEIHVRISDDIYNYIKDYSCINKTTFSKSINCILNKIININYKDNQVANILQIVQHIKENSFVIKELLEQLYSDLDFENYTYKEKCKMLKQFYSKSFKYNTRLCCKDT